MEDKCMNRIQNKNVPYSIALLCYLCVTCHTITYIDPQLIIILILDCNRFLHSHQAYGVMPTQCWNPASIVPILLQLLQRYFISIGLRCLGSSGNRSETDSNKPSGDLTMMKSCITETRSTSFVICSNWLNECFAKHYCCDVLPGLYSCFAVLCVVKVGTVEFNQCQLTVSWYKLNNAVSWRQYGADSTMWCVNISAGTCCQQLWI